MELRDFVRVMVGRLMNPDKPSWHARLMMRELTEPTSACSEWVEEYVRPHARGLADVLAAPVIKALLGKAVIPDDSPYTTGGLGLVGCTAALLVLFLARKRLPS